MSIIVYEGTIIEIVVRNPKSKWQYFTNAYLEEETGEEYDESTMPSAAKGHTYTIRAIRQAGDWLEISNKLRAWDKESVPVIHDLGGTARVGTATASAPTDFNMSSAFIPLRHKEDFLRRAQTLGWTILPRVYEKDCLERLRTLNQTDLEEAEITRKVQYYDEILANPMDPYLVDHPGEYEQLAAEVAMLKARLPDSVKLEDVITFLSRVFPWAKTAGIEDSAIVIPLSAGKLLLSRTGVWYKSTGLSDGIRVGGSRLKTLLE